MRTQKQPLPDVTSWSHLHDSILLTKLAYFRRRTTSDCPTFTSITLSPRTRQQYVYKNPVYMVGSGYCKRRVRCIQWRFCETVSSDNIRTSDNACCIDICSTTTELTTSWASAISQAFSLSPSNKVVEFGIRGVCTTPFNVLHMF